MTSPITVPVLAGPKPKTSVRLVPEALRARWDGPPGGDRLAAASALPAPAARAVLRATVATEAEQAGSETEFFTRLRAASVLVRERFSTINPDEVTGYAVALPGCTGSDGAPRWYGGGRLHDSLSLSPVPSITAQVAGWTAGTLAADRAARSSS